LTQGSHQLIVRGREAGVQLNRFSVIQVPDAPQNLRVVSSSP
jgi:hypothetical protein